MEQGDNLYFLKKFDGGQEIDGHVGWLSPGKLKENRQRAQKKEKDSNNFT